MMPFKGMEGRDEEEEIQVRVLLTWNYPLLFSTFLA